MNVKTKQNNINTNNSIRRDNTLFILDWDDTLFPTHWTITNAINFNVIEVVNRYLVYFGELDKLLYKLLKRFLEYGNVVIVTNAIALWVRISCRVLPSTYTLFSDNKINVISARDNYKNKSESMMEWKSRAFSDIIDKLYDKSVFMNVISIGDAEYEYKALVNLNNKKNYKLLKSVRLIKDPSFETLVDELEVLYTAIPDVSKQGKNLDLNFDFFTANRIR